AELLPSHGRKLTELRVEGCRNTSGNMTCLTIRRSKGFADEFVPGQVTSPLHFCLTRLRTISFMLPLHCTPSVCQGKIAGYNLVVWMPPHVLFTLNCFRDVIPSLELDDYAAATVAKAMETWRSLQSISL